MGRQIKQPWYVQVTLARIEFKRLWGEGILPAPETHHFEPYNAMCFKCGQDRRAKIHDTGVTRIT